jgi:phthalate 4,5-dioxygenase
VLKTEVNELLTQTGPGTPAGNLFRQYWLPALHIEELPENDCPPVRVKILSERLIAFRDSEGRFGLMDEFCAHRGVSLWFGRVEEGGLRCAYHGWKYDVTGQCLEVPSEPENSNFCSKVQLTAYPLVKVGEILWTYMGDPANQPALPEFEFCDVPEEQTYTSKRWQESNWLQALEGGIDSSHVSWLHSGGLKSDPLFKGTKGNEYNLNDLRPFFEVAEADGGLFVGARRNAEDGKYYWRITPYVMPSFTIVPPRGDHPVHGHFWVPIDDENCWVYNWQYAYDPKIPVSREYAEEHETMYGRGPGDVFPGTFRLKKNLRNDYDIDRQLQKTQTFTGIVGINTQDMALQEGMGRIVDRSKEHLGTSDRAIIAMRQLLMEAMDAVESGEKIRGLDPADYRDVRAVDLMIPLGVEWREALKDELVAKF